MERPLARFADARFYRDGVIGVLSGMVLVKPSFSVRGILFVAPCDIRLDHAPHCQTSPRGAPEVPFRTASWRQIFLPSRGWQE